MAVRGADGIGHLQEDDYQKRTEIRVVIPDYFKVCLVDDWEAVTKNQQVSHIRQLAGHTRLVC